MTAQAQVATASPAGRGRMGRWLVIYALAVVYVSVVVSPLGFNFVPRDPAVAWQMFLDMRYAKHGVDQRADQISNLLMFMPLGALAVGTLSRRNGSRLLASTMAFLGCAVFALVVKYAQLFVPPRTVSLNYVLLQLGGAAVGIATYWVLRSPSVATALALWGSGRVVLPALLRVYTVALVLFYLFPLNFVVGMAELQARLAEVPGLLWTLPGIGRPTAQQVVVLALGVAAPMPIGMLFALDRRRSYVGIVLLALLLMGGVTLISILVAAGNVSLVSLAMRLAGVLLGAALLRGLERIGTARLRAMLAMLVPWLVLPYLVALVLVNELVSSRWASFDQILAMAADTRIFLPLWHHYIVPKAQAVSSVIVHVIMYAPIGLYFALRDRTDRPAVWGAATLGFLLAFAVEIGRWVKLFVPDFNNAAIAAIAAGAAVKLLPAFWRLLDEMLGRPLRYRRPEPVARRTPKGPLW